MRFRLPALLCVLLFAAATPAQDVRLGVFGLFHPQELVLSADRGEAVVVRAGGRTLVLDAHSQGALRVRLVDGVMRLASGDQALEAREIRAASRDGEPVRFTLAVPGRLTRPFRGRLTLGARGAELVPVVATDLESAVAGAVEAESRPGTPPAALEAQAVVARSYYLAGGGRHRDFDFCDLTHCQLFRDPPGPASRNAAKATAGLVLVFAGQPVVAMFTRSCGGHTRTPAELGLPGNAYPYAAVLCRRCYENPDGWTRRLRALDGALAARGEAGRLAVNRRLGWTTVPSNHFTVEKDGREVVLHGAGRGHGMGLCQRGAEGMAESGSTFREILAHYFRETRITASEPQAAR